MSSFEGAFSSTGDAAASRLGVASPPSPPAVQFRDRQHTAEPEVETDFLVDSEDRAEEADAVHQQIAAIVNDGTVIDSSSDYFDVPTYRDKRDDLGKSARRKLGSALFHLNSFLKQYARQIEWSYQPGDQLVLKLEPNPEDPSEVSQEWFDSMIGCFFDYCGKYACKRGRSDLGRVSYETATGYCSSIKAFYLNCWRNKIEIEPSVFRESNWRSLRKKLLSDFQEESRLTGKSITDPHQASSNSDRKAIAFGCAWANTYQAAQFQQLNTSCTQFVGRGSEVSLVKPEHLTVATMDEFNYSYPIIKSRLKRHKNHELQNLPMYPHRDEWCHDWYFSTAMCLVIGGSSHEFITPAFAEKALNVSEDKCDSKVSSYWSKVYKKLFPFFQQCDININGDLTSHHGKKAGSQKLADTPGVSGLSQIFRTGWQLRGFHSLFDYVIGSEVMCQQSGKALSNWTTKVGDVTIGGQPAKLNEAGPTESAKLYEFVTQIFADDVEKQYSDDVRSLLVAAILRHYDDFVDALRLDPDGTFVGDCTNHLFVNKIHEHLHNADVSMDTFKEWKSQVREGFFQRNMLALPIESFARHSSDGRAVERITMDPRCFVDHHNALVSTYQALLCQYHTQRDDIRSINEKVEVLTTANSELVYKIDAMLHNQNNNNEILISLFNISRNASFSEPSESASTPTLLPASQNTNSPTSPDAIHATLITPSQSPNEATTPRLPYVAKFSVISQSWETQGYSLADYFYSFFSDRCHAGYNKDLEDPQWRNLAAKQRNKLKQKFARLKQTVLMMLLVSDTCPNYANTDFSVQELQEWRSNLRILSQNLQNQIDNDFFEGAKTSQNRLHNSEQFKTIRNDTSNCLPHDTSDELLEFFTRKRKEPPESSNSDSE